VRETPRCRHRKLAGELDRRGRATHLGSCSRPLAQAKPADRLIQPLGNPSTVPRRDQ
jgi:hypothetical protein